MFSAACMPRIILFHRGRMYVSFTAGTDERDGQTPHWSPGAPLASWSDTLQCYSPCRTPSLPHPQVLLRLLTIISILPSVGLEPGSLLCAQ